MLDFDHAASPVEIASGHILAAKHFNDGISPDPISHQRFLNEGAKTVEYLINSLNLPIPQTRDQFFEGKEGILLFAEEYGMVVRLETATAQVTEQVNQSPFILPALVQFAHGNMNLEVCPSVETPVTGRAAFWLADRLKEDGLMMDGDELDPRNCGYLPIKTDEWPDGIPIVLDRSSIYPDPDYDPSRAPSEAHIAAREISMVAKRSIGLSPFPTQPGISVPSCVLSSAVCQKSTILAWSISRPFAVHS